MSKVASSITNFNYASELKRRGFKTAVHALPLEGLDYVNSLLSKGIPTVEIANLIEKEWGAYIKQLGLKPISAYSVRSYRDNWWAKGIGLGEILNRNPVMQSKLETAIYQADAMLEEFDALRSMITVAKKQKALILEKDSQLEDNPMGIVDGNRDAARFRFFQMCKGIHEIYASLGIVRANQNPIKFEGTIEEDETITEDRKELKERVTKLLDVLNKKGKYGRKITGERVGTRTIKK